MAIHAGDSNAAPTQIGVEDLRIDADDLKARLESGESTLVLDARGQTAWQSSPWKVRGAVRVDEENFKVDPAWSPDQFTLVYSADLHDATSGMVARQLLENGFREVHVLRGGFEAWQAAQGPVEQK